MKRFLKIDVEILEIVLVFSILNNWYITLSAWRSGGFLAQKFNRSTALEPTTKLSYEALNPPLRQTAVSGSFYFLVVKSKLKLVFIIKPLLF